MQQYAKLVEGQLITTCADKEDTELISQLLTDGFKIYEGETGKPYVEGLQSLSSVYREEDNKIVHYWEIVDNSPDKVKKEIARLEEKLAATDYKVVKSYEYDLAGQELPYEVKALHAERQEIREQIKKLELIL